MVAAFCAIAGIAVAAMASGVLAGRVIEERQGWLLSWLVASLAACLGLASVAIGQILGYGPTIFRAMELGAALLTPLWLAIGLIDVVVENARVRFAVRLAGSCCTLPAVLVLLGAPVTGSFSGEFPAAAAHWSSLPPLVISLVDIAALGTVLVGVTLAAVRARGGDEYDRENLLAAMAVGPACLFVLLAVRLDVSPVLIALALTLAACALWYAVGSPLAAPYEDADEDDAYEEAVGVPSRRIPAARVPLDDVLHSAPVTAELGTPSPNLYGRISVYTLAEGSQEAFDRLARTVVEAVREGEPDTLIFMAHAVRDAPLQRIFYEVYRDELALVEHEQQPHIRHFTAEHRKHVVASNVIDVSLAAAKVVVAPTLLGLPA